MEVEIEHLFLTTDPYNQKIKIDLSSLIPPGVKQSNRLSAHNNHLLPETGLRALRAQLNGNGQMGMLIAAKRIKKGFIDCEFHSVFLSFRTRFQLC